MVEVILFELIFIEKIKKHLKRMLWIESVVISIPFFYWFIMNTEWVFFISIIAYFISQIIREQKIKRIIEEEE